MSCVSCLSVCATTSYYAGMFSIHIVPTLIIIESFEIISCGPRAGVVIVKIIMFIILRNLTQSAPRSYVTVQHTEGEHA